MRPRWAVALACVATGVLACGDIVDWLAGSYQPRDPAGGAPYLIIQAAPDSVQATNANLGTIVYIQASGGDRIGIRTIGGTFALFPQNAGPPAACLPVIPLTAIVVQTAPQTESILLVDLLTVDGGAPSSDDASDDGGATSDSAPDAPVGTSDGPADGQSDTGAANAADATPGEPDRDESLACGPGYAAIRSAAAVVTNSRVVVLDGGLPDGADGGPDGTIADGSESAATDGPEGGPSDGSDGG